MQCAYCDTPLKPSERGQECAKCKQWPLCDDCVGDHVCEAEK